MSQATMVEIGGNAFGIAVRDAGQFRYYASDRRVSRLEGQVLRSLTYLQRAVAGRLGERCRAERSGPL
jgi:hypothetical protein